MADNDRPPDDPVYEWDSTKFGMQPGDVWTTLHDRFNTQRTAIQDPEAFHHDVVEISKQANTREEFYDLLEQRRRLRLDELNTVFDEVATGLTSHPRWLGASDTDRWYQATRVAGFRSFDALLSFMMTYVPDSYWKEQEAATSQKKRWSEDSAKLPSVDLSDSYNSDSKDPDENRSWVDITDPENPFVTDRPMCASPAPEPDVFDIQDDASTCSESSSLHRTFSEEGSIPSSSNTTISTTSLPSSAHSSPPLPSSPIKSELDPFLQALTKSRIQSTRDISKSVIAGRIQKSIRTKGPLEQDGRRHSQRLRGVS